MAFPLRHAQLLVSDRRFPLGYKRFLKQDENLGPYGNVMANGLD
jgi:hypothetical protein